MAAAHDIRTLVDPITGRPVLMAPARRNRPIQTADLDGAAPCPFCAGSESLTPPEVDAEREAHGGADGPGWVARAFPNLYPAAPAHEVIAEGATHTVQPAALTVEVWEAALRLHRRRIQALEARPGIACAFLFKNVGLRAGASIAHNHTQILGLPALPPRLELMVQRLQAANPCPLRTDVATAEGEGRVVFANAHYVVHSPATPKLPFETWLSPRDGDEDFLHPPDEGAFAGALHAAFVAFDAAFGAPPFNVYLLRDPQRRFAWHVELQPRTGNIAGLELGGDMYINSIPGTEAAARLRAARTRTADS